MKRFSNIILAMVRDMLLFLACEEKDIVAMGEHRGDDGLSQ